MTGYLARLKAKIQEKPIPHELSKRLKGPFGGFGSGQGEHVCRNQAQPEKPFDSFGSSQGMGFSEIGGSPAGLPELQERIGMAAGSVPERYLDTWARLQCQRPWPSSLGAHRRPPSPILRSSPSARIKRP
jgi:hypothetical protein